MKCPEEDKLKPRCRLSDPAHPHTLCRRDNPPPSDCFKCGPLKAKAFKDGGWHYYCDICELVFHDNCHTNPQDPPFKIENPKSHQHPLTFFPRPLIIPCSACGLTGNKDPSYTCLPCNYFVHKSCIDLPRVIKLTRHPHRLSLTPCLPPSTKRKCGVCHRSIDVKNGLYSCNKGCSYAAHSICATHKDVWDGIDLEGVPEEPFEDVSPFEEVGYNLINHFSHEHHLRFHEKGFDHDVGQQCEVCSQPIDSHGFYKCTIFQCRFFLHATCANLPKKKEHPLHKHPLVLRPGELTACDACKRLFNGFRYACSINNCQKDGSFEIDVGCASICEPFEHKIHPHPLFIYPLQINSSKSKNEEKTLNVCGVCGEKCYQCIINCDDCQFVMCFKCATIPVVVHYKHDEHPLILCCGENSGGLYWCEVCEKQIDPNKWFYTCDDCCTTAHVECIFGPFMHLKAGTFYCMVNNIQCTYTIGSNKGNTRPVCDRCGDRCLYTGFYKVVGDVSHCSSTCT
ncbi:unnamed protein product [Arabidopsis thaliana]|uniref:Zinc finger PHD-type domain-containing protein n=1 Tax=Arabidopsis thaliana TaxID=3702 RepID=A0A5S9YCV7_ARATH|nr:unnamed protein product [Arabidopsis thaliana]